MSDTPKTPEEQAEFDKQQAEQNRIAEERAQAELESAKRRQQQSEEGTKEGA